MKKAFLYAGIILITLSACKSNSSDKPKENETAGSELVINPDAIVQMDIMVDGMTCTGCENTINTGVGEIAGVVDVTSDFQKGLAVVKFDSTQATIEKISEAITKKGYSVTGYSIHSQETAPSTDTQ